jgi:hypothetical protein
MIILPAFEGSKGFAIACRARDLSAQLAMIRERRLLGRCPSFDPTGEVHHEVDFKLKSDCIARGSTRPRVSLHSNGNAAFRRFLKVIEGGKA